MKQGKARERICELNDAFRRSFIGGRVMLTQSVAALANETKAKLLAEVRAFSYFDGGNDPHGEHDFGSLVTGGTKFFWKIDYFDLAMSQHSVNAANAEATVRVLTIMRADEY